MNTALQRIRLCAHTGGREAHTRAMERKGLDTVSMSDAWGRTRSCAISEMCSSVWYPLLNCTNAPKSKSLVTVAVCRWPTCAAAASQGFTSGFYFRVLLPAPPPSALPFKRPHLYPRVMRSGAMFSAYPRL